MAHKNENYSTPNCGIICDVLYICRGLEIRAFEQKIQVQSIRPETPIKFIASGKNTLVASPNGVFKLEPCPYDRQVQDCIQNKQFELALAIAVSLEEGGGREGGRERREGDGGREGGRGGEEGGREEGGGREGESTC